MTVAFKFHISFYILQSFLADQEVGVEDAHGNVMTPQTYEDLRKQGLL